MTESRDPWDPTYYGSGEGASSSIDRPAASPAATVSIGHHVARRWWMLAVVSVVVGGAFVFGARDDDDPTPIVAQHTFPPISTPSNTSGTLSAIPPIGQRATPNTANVGPFPTVSSTGTLPPFNGPGSIAPEQTAATPVTLNVRPTAPIVDTLPGPGTSVPTPVSSPTSATSQASPAPTELPSLGPLVIQNPDGLGLYLNSGFGGPNSNLRIDLSTGDVSALKPSYSSSDTVGLVGTGSDIRLLIRGDLGGNAAAPCSDGTWWVSDVDDRGQMTRLQRVRPHVDARVAPEVLVTVTMTPALQAMTLTTWTESGDRPILHAPDGGTYAVDPSTAVLQRIGSGRVDMATHGFFSETVCDDASACATRLHGANGTTATILASSQRFVSFSPDGTHALVGSAGATFANDTGGPPLIQLELVTPSTGAAVPILVTSVTNLGFSSSPYAWALWTPDGSTAFFFDGTNVIEVDAGTGATSVHPLPPSLNGQNLALVGIA